jgi:NAD(P)-dependent dehydrogenase (short-subunit alcohol dehydrogenase family)
MMDWDLNGMDMGNGFKHVGLKNLKPLKDILDLKGKVAIVSGGSRGLGARIVARLCEGGASCVISDVGDGFAEKAIEYFNTKNYQVKYIRTDVRSLAQINAAVDYAVKEFGKVDILVNNAAVYRMDKFSDVTEEIWDAGLDINLKGTFFFIQAVAKQMIKQGQGGRIINISSNAGNSMENSYGFMIPYVASKSGVNGITKSLARELKPHGIHINAVVPGGMLSIGGMAREKNAEIDEIRKANPPAPMSDSDNVARMVYIMATEMSDYMDGSVVFVDGGTYLGFRK